MKTLTQVWLICFTGCFFLLITGFQLAGRLGLFLSFLTSLFFIYLIFYRGLKIFIQQTQAVELIGNDPHQFLDTTQKLALVYGFKNVKIFLTHKNSPPLVWPEFSSQLHIFIHKNILVQMSDKEKVILSHLLLSHGATQSKLSRKFMGLLYISLFPLSPFLSPVFNFFSYALGLSLEIYKADLRALRQGEATQFEFGLLLHKLHHLSFHREEVFEGTYFFSILSKINPRLYNLEFHPHIKKREKNIMGYSI